jgi:hypothetical protein
MNLGQEQKFCHKLPAKVGARQPHNKAKCKLAETMNDNAKCKHPPRCWFHRRINRNLIKLDCGKKEKGVRKGMYCANPDGINLDCVSKKCQFPLSDMNLVDNSSIEKSKGQYLIGKDEDGNEEFIFIHLPSCKSNMLKNKHPTLRAIFQKALKIKPDDSRGSKSNGVTDRYIMYDYRKEPKGSNIGECSFCSNSSEKDREDVSAEVANFVGSLE